MHSLRLINFLLNSNRKWKLLSGILPADFQKQKYKSGLKLFIGWLKSNLFYLAGKNKF